MNDLKYYHYYVRVSCWKVAKELAVWVGAFSPIVLHVVIASREAAWQSHSWVNMEICDA
jgi:hypothetical protein